MNNICKQYIKQVQTLFPIMGKKERAYIKNLSSDLEDFCEEESIQSLDELYSQFGDPVDTLNNYFSSMDISDTIKRISITKWIKRIILYLLILITCAGIAFGIYQYRVLKVIEHNQLMLIETTIE